MMTLSFSKYFILLCIALPFLTGRTFAQDGQDEIKTVLEKIEHSYQQRAYLRFHVKYLYANEHNPDRPTDSLSGDIEMDKDRCRYFIDGTETLVTAAHTIQVMPEDRAIYLSGPTRAGKMDPVNHLDSLLKNTKGIHTDIRHETGLDVLSLSFGPGFMYSRLEIATEPRSGYLQRITYFLHTEGLVGKEMISAPGHDGPYEPEGRVSILFSHYEHGSFGEAAFNEENIITKVGGRYVPSQQYKGYQILLGSPNL